MGKAWRACLSPIPLSSAGAHHSDETIAAHVIAYSSMEIGRESSYCLKLRILAAQGQQNRGVSCRVSARHNHRGIVR